VTIPTPHNMSEVYDLLRYVRSKKTGTIVIVLDEVDRLSSDQDRLNLAELITNVSAIISDMRFILCGIGADVDAIIGSHLSTGRMFESIDLPKLKHNDLWKIISRVADKVNVTIDQGYYYRIGIISDGFPAFVHLIGECLFWAMHDSEYDVSHCERGHFDLALKDALTKAEPALRTMYQMATEKTKNTLEYEEALWSLADRAATRRQLQDIYETSYRRIVAQRDHTRQLTKHQLNHRLLRLREESHASVVKGYGSGWFSFRENVMRGYVRLKAESEGIELAEDPTT